MTSSICHWMCTSIKYLHNCSSVTFSTELATGLNAMLPDTIAVVAEAANQLPRFTYHRYLARLCPLTNQSQQEVMLQNCTSVCSQSPLFLASSEAGRRGKLSLCCWSIEPASLGQSKSQDDSKGSQPGSSPSHPAANWPSPFSMLCIICSGICHVTSLMGRTV